MRVYQPVTAGCKSADGAYPAARKWRGGRTVVYCARHQSMTSVKFASDTQFMPWVAIWYMAS